MKTKTDILRLDNSFEIDYRVFEIEKNKFNATATIHDLRRYPVSYYPINLSDHFETLEEAENAIRTTAQEWIRDNII